MSKYLLFLLYTVLWCNICEVKSNRKTLHDRKIYESLGKNNRINFSRIEHNVSEMYNTTVTDFHKITNSTIRKIEKKLNNEAENDKPKITENIKANSILVTTDSGLIRGKLVIKNDMSYFSFLGIPYAEKPIRFQPSKPVNRWNGVKEAINETDECPQKLLFPSEIGGNEDCLTLNINTPILQNSKLPVVVWIFGGAFKYGTAKSSYYSPERFIEEEITVVTVNYRVGALGFLATNTKHAPGNIGLKDIVIALRWIQKNINYFGGDNQNICIYGVSSGAAAVEYLTLSPMSKGLYQKAIIHSGSALCEVFHIKKPVETAFQLGRYLGSRTKNIDELMYFLYNMSAYDIVEAQEKMDDDELYPFSLHFAPITEEYPSEEVFLSDDPEKVLQSGKYDQIPMLFGFNDKEGLYFLANSRNLDIYLNDLNEILEYVTPPSIMNNVNTQSKREILQKIKDFYFKNKTLEVETMNEFVDFSGDSVFLYGIHKSLDTRSKNSKSSIYYYEFAYADDDSIFQYHDIKIKGAGHADDMRYTFKLFGKGLVNPNSECIAKKFIKLYSNFIKYGNPTPSVPESNITIKWLPIGKNKLQYLKLTENMEMIESPNEARYEFWERIYSEYK